MKKILALLLALCLTMGLMAGCGDQASSSSAASSAPAESAEAPAPADEEPADADEPAAPVEEGSAAEELSLIHISRGCAARE